MSKQKNNMSKKVSPPTDRYDRGYETNSIPGINSPEISLPAFNPPVPNRAWTAMRKEMTSKIDMLKESEKKDLTYHPEI